MTWDGVVWYRIGQGSPPGGEGKDDDTNEEVVGRVAIRANTRLCLTKETSMD